MVGNHSIQFKIVNLLSVENHDLTMILSPSACSFTKKVIVKSDYVTTPLQSTFVFKLYDIYPPL